MCFSSLCLQMKFKMFLFITTMTRIPMTISTYMAGFIQLHEGHRRPILFTLSSRHYILGGKCEDFPWSI